MDDRDKLIAQLRRHWADHGATEPRRLLGLWVSDPPMIVHILFDQHDTPRYLLRRRVAPRADLDFEAYLIVWDVIEPLGSVVPVRRDGVGWIGDVMGAELRWPPDDQRVSVDGWVINPSQPL